MKYIVLIFMNYISGTFTESLASASGSLSGSEPSNPVTSHTLIFLSKQPLTNKSSKNVESGSFNKTKTTEIATLPAYLVRGESPPMIRSPGDGTETTH